MLPTSGDRCPRPGVAQNIYACNSFLQHSPASSFCNCGDNDNENDNDNDNDTRPFKSESNRESESNSDFTTSLQLYVTLAY